MSKNLKIVFSFIILFIGVMLLSNEYMNSKKIAVYDYMNELYYDEVAVTTEEIETTIEDNTTEETIIEEKKEKEEDTSYKFTNKTNESIYIGYLIIPDIDLKKGFTKKESTYNNVNKNIQILSSSDYPDKENGNVILAGHSGNSSVSYFNTLYLINKGANIYIDFNNIKYTYKITNIYTVNKTGKAEIIRDKNKSCITLITCTKNDNTTQTIYIGELIGKE